tara:strand:- start:191 stop:1111 length:921 start_codon:yes stop_codon:yes gene_type:complete
MNKEYLLKIKNKFQERYMQFNNHPLVKNAIIGMLKYIFINIIIRLYNKPIKMKWINNLKYYLSLGDSGIIGNYYFYIDDYEESIFLIHYLNKQDVFIDVGSNHGHYTMIASGISNCNSIAIEPVKSTFDRLKMNIELNRLNNVKLYNLGISDSDGELIISNNMGSMNRIIDGVAKNNSEMISVTTLDKISVSEKKIDLIKIDVEGYEKQVLLGGENTLQNPNLNVIIIELNNSNFQYGYHEDETISILNNYGFSPYRYIYPNNVLMPLERKNFDSYNTIFIRNINDAKNRIKKKSITIKDNILKVT